MNCSKGRGSLEEREMGLTLLGLRVRTLVHHFVPLFFFLFRRNVVFTEWKLLKKCGGNTNHQGAILHFLNSCICNSLEALKSYNHEFNCVEHQRNAQSDILKNSRGGKANGV